MKLEDYLYLFTVYTSWINDKVSVELNLSNTIIQEYVTNAHV